MHGPCGGDLPEMGEHPVMIQIQNEQGKYTKQGTDRYSEDYYAELVNTRLPRHDGYLWVAANNSWDLGGPPLVTEHDPTAREVKDVPGLR